MNAWTDAYRCCTVDIFIYLKPSSFNGNQKIYTIWTTAMFIPEEGKHMFTLEER